MVHKIIKESLINMFICNLFIVFLNRITTYASKRHYTMTETTTKLNDK